MATKIKALKCPQCGSEKHSQIDEKRFLCKNCGTEFYIDDDDININVNHRFDVRATSDVNNNLAKIAKGGIIAFVLPFVIIAFFFTMAMFFPSHSSTFGNNHSVTVRNQSLYIFPMKHKGKMGFFYIASRNYYAGYNNDEAKYVNGYYYGFRDAQTGKVLTDKLLISYEEANQLSMSSFTMSNLRYFYQSKRWFLIIPERFVYEIDPQALTMKNVSKSLFDGKKAMSTGLSKIDFIYKKYGEGFEVTNNMAEQYFFFPGTNRLYTPEAYNYAYHLPPEELGKEMRDSIYYQLQCTGNGTSGNTQGRLRMWKLHIKFHLGDPQDTGYFTTDMESRWHADQRLVSAEPVSAWFTGFDANIRYQDTRYVLITFKPNISPDANTVFQLMSTDGRLLWTQVADHRLEVDMVDRDNNKLWFRGITRHRKDPDEYHAYSLDLTNGKLEQHYLFPTNYSIEAQ